MTMQKDDVRRIVEGTHHEAFSVLGMHTSDEGRGVKVRAFLPEAAEAWVVDERTGKTYPMEKVHKKGFFRAAISIMAFPYRLRIKTEEGEIAEFRDPYSFERVLTDFDLHLIGAGSHYKKYEKLGAHVMEIDGVKGVHFGVWAPNARVVSVIGDFNRWDNRRHPMRLIGTSGIWEGFIPGLGEGEIYKFEIRSMYHNYHTVNSA